MQYIFFMFHFIILRYYNMDLYVPNHTIWTYTFQIISILLQYHTFFHVFYFTFFSHLYNYTIIVHALYVYMYMYTVCIYVCVYMYIYIYVFYLTFNFHIRCLYIQTILSCYTTNHTQWLLSLKWMSAYAKDYIFNT